MFTYTAQVMKFSIKDLGTNLDWVYISIIYCSEYGQSIIVHNIISLVMLYISSNRFKVYQSSNPTNILLDRGHAASEVDNANFK